MEVWRDVVVPVVLRDAGDVEVVGDVGHVIWEH